MDLGFLAPLMFFSLFALLLTGYPVAFVLGAVGMAFGALGIWAGVIPLPLVQAVPSGTSHSDAIRLFLQIAAEQAQSPNAPPAQGAPP